MFEIYDSPGVAVSTNEIQKPTNGVIVHEQVESVVETKFSKAAQEYVSKHNIDTKKFNGLAFVTTKDLVPQETVAPKPKEGKPALQPAVVKEINASNKTLKPLSSNKKREFEYLYSVNSSSVISRLSTVIVVNNKEAIGKAQHFITSTPLPSIIQEVSKLLLKYPNLNSFYMNGEQAFYNEVNIGFALDDGKNAIEDSISDLSLKYANQQLTALELTSTTFTITDLFNTNVVSFHPLVNSNNSSILGISAFHNGEFVVDLSFDHRTTSGKEVSQFLDDLKFRLETRFGIIKATEANGAVAEEVDQDIHCFKCLRDVSDDLGGNLYFLKVANSHDHGYICSNCLKGW